MDQRGRPRLFQFWHSLRAAFKRPALWLFCWSVPLTLAIVMALPWKAWFTTTLASSYAPGSLFATMSETFRFDHREGLDALKTQSGALAAMLGICVILFRTFCAGGWLQVFLERAKSYSLRRFFWGGARYFWRFVRLIVLSLLLLSFAGWVVYGWPFKILMNLFFGAEDGNLEVLVSESSALRVGWLQAGAYALLVALLFAWGDYTRTRMALQNTRSALWAGLCTMGLFISHPVQTLRPFALLLLLEVLVVLGVGRFSYGLNGGLDELSGWGSIALLFLLAQVALLFQTVTLGARYHAAVTVSLRVVPPLAQPDPWASRVGGPGGPQYPIDDADDYGVSI
jgi:hypothetical protein